MPQKRFRNKDRKRRSRNSGGSNRKPLTIEQFIKTDFSNRSSEPEFVPSWKFEDAILHPVLQRSLRRKGYEFLTEIQEKAMPQIMEGHDVIGIAGTGTGKTAAFLLPILLNLLEKPKENNALILAPTRELATQILTEFVSLARGLNLYASALIGGEHVSKSITALKRRNHVIIGTPGRVQDMADRGLLTLGSFEALVLDEFDRMMDMGFINEVEEIQAGMKRKKNTYLFSATESKSIQKNIEKFTKEPVRVKARNHEDQNLDIQQEIFRVPPNSSKHEIVSDLITDHKTILFCETKRKVDKVHKSLKESGHKSEYIHGDKSQQARNRSLQNFIKGKASVLVATDVVARGIDVKDVSLVINYEAPRNYEDYVHRIGRTGRAGKTGKAITLV